jgi:hypothetical protein
MFGVTVNPVSGTAYTNNNIGLTVIAPTTSGGSSGGTGNCASSDGTLNRNGQVNPVFTTGQAKQVYSYLIPASIMALNNVVQLVTVQNTGVQNAGLGIELVISPCAGDFSNQVPANCTVFANAEAGQLWVATSAASASKFGTSCVVAPPASNTPYYANVRLVKPDLTPSCLLNGQTVSGLQCSFIMQLHWAPS